MKSVKDKRSIRWIIIDFKGVQQRQRKISNMVDEKGKLVIGLMRENEERLIDSLINRHEE